MKRETWVGKVAESWVGCRDAIRSISILVESLFAHTQPVRSLLAAGKPAVEPRRLQCLLDRMMELVNYRLVLVDSSHWMNRFVAVVAGWKLQLVIEKDFKIFSHFLSFLIEKEKKI